jgi:hypothetical protein
VTGPIVENVLTLLAFIVLWVVLQTWILPRFGVPT